jgi:hypothetical protein
MLTQQSSAYSLDVHPDHNPPGHVLTRVPETLLYVSLQRTAIGCAGGFDPHSPSPYCVWYKDYHGPPEILPKDPIFVDPVVWAEPRDVFPANRNGMPLQRTG